MLLRVICACVLFGILVAGLWPFHAPRNDVSWLREGNGLVFGKHGSIVSASPLKPHASQRNNSCTLEMWLAPSRIDSDRGMILAFYWPEGRVVPFALHQLRDGLVLEHKSDYPAKKTGIYVGDVFSSLKPVVVTITSSEAGTAMYADGVLIKIVPNFVISNRDLTGQLVIANAPSTHYSWAGLLKGLALYDRELSPAEVTQAPARWSEGTQPDPSKSQGVIARYVFDERKGNVVHNQVDSETDFLIPERFFVLHEQFLERPWDEFRSGWRYWKDIGVNVVGFIPLGFFFCAYFSQVRTAEHSVAMTVALGFAVSLTIEVLQAFLPTRDSGMTDLITNTLGTAIGVMAFRLGTVRALMSRAGLY